MKAVKRMKAAFLASTGKDFQSLHIKQKIHSNVNLIAKMPCDMAGFCIKV
jgi:hypothetical protein